MASAQTMQSRQHKNPNIDKLVELGDKIFEKYEAKKDQIADADIRGFMTTLLHELDRNIRQFKTNRFFIAVFGALKAGKSTLINALAEHYTSPSGYGYETTLHCSLILCADEEHPEGIYLYQLTGNKKREETDRQEKARELLDYFRGLYDWEFISKGGNWERSERYLLNGHDLHPSKDNLEAVLTEAVLSRYPQLMLVEIRIKSEKDDNFLLKNIGILDMPGLDGSIANVKTDPIIAELPKAADYFLYVQSSIAAINSGARDYILSLINNSKEYIVVFNEIRAQYWLKSEVQSEVIEEQNNKAIGHLAKSLGVNPPRSFRINAAQAWDSKNRRFQVDKLMDGLTLEKLYDDSHIQDLKNEISKLCQNSVTEILDKNALNSLKEWIKTALPLEDFTKLQEEINQRWKQDLKKWDAIDQKLKDIRLTEKNLTIQDAQAEVEEKIKKLFKGKIKDATKYDIKNYLGNDYGKTKQEQYAKADKKLLEEVCGSGQKNDIENQSRTYCDEFVETVRAAVEKQIGFHLNTKNDESLLSHAVNYKRKLEDIKARIKSANNTFKIDSNPDNQPLIPWLQRRWPFFESSIKDCCSNYFQNFQERFEGAVKEYSKSKMDLIKSCVADLWKALNEDVGKWRNEYNEKTKKITADIEFIREFQKDLSDLEEARKRVYQS